MAHSWDVLFESDGSVTLEVPDGYTTMLLVIKGSVCVGGIETIEAAEFGLFNRAGERIEIDSAKGARVLLLSGDPIDEPIVGQGPFVMNSAQEIRQAIVDYQNGRMGCLL